MLIESIEPSGKHKGLYEIAFDNGARLITNQHIIADNYIYKGKEIDEDVFRQLKNAFDLARTRKRALEMLSRRPLSRAEVVKKLTEKGESAESAEQVANWLEEKRFIDDGEYARLVVNHYSGKGYGPYRVRDELYKRGVDRELWDEALENMPVQDEDIDRFIMSKLRGDVPDMKDKKRVSDALARRGFSWDDIRSGIRRYEESLDQQ